jgi:hypothetical protein
MKNIIIILLLCNSTFAFAQKTNYSGTWQIDKSKTQFGDAPEWVIPKIIKIDQQTNKLVLGRVSLDEKLQEQAPITDTLSFDDKPFQRKDSITTVVTTLNWTDNNSFTIKRNGHNIAKESWSLEDDGNSLVIDRKVEQPDGFKYNIKCYYKKQ